MRQTPDVILHGRSLHNRWRQAGIGMQHRKWDPGNERCQRHLVATGDVHLLVWQPRAGRRVVDAGVRGVVASRHDDRPVAELRDACAEAAGQPERHSNRAADRRLLA